METDEESASPPVRILIAEDSPTQAERLRHLLATRGYEVAVAANGLQALEIAPKFIPALIISDVVMPEMDGYTLSRRIKDHPTLGATPVILVTSLSDPQDVISGLESGADNFIIKPFEERDLLARVQYVLFNREIRNAREVGIGVEIYFNGKRHYITADRLQILNLLLSTYDAAINRNKELSRVQEELRSLNTRLETANDELKSTNRFLDSVVENIPNMIFVKDAADLRFVRFNAAGEQLTGHSRAALLGKTDHDFYPPEQADFFVARDREALEGRVIVDIPEEPILTRDRGKRILHTKKIPIPDASGQPRYLLGISEDVTERREKEKEILALNAALKQRATEVEAANRELESFSYSVSHDLRAPLRHVLGYIELLEGEAGKVLSEEARRYLSIVSESATSMSQLIDDLLEFSRMARADMSKTQVDLDRMVRDSVERLRQDLGDRNVDWRIDQLPSVSGDPAMLGQVFANLLGNAVKYTRPRDAALIEIGCAGEEDGFLVLYVRDNGVGFDMKYAGKLFGVFQRLHREDEFEGTGIGLANVQRIVSRHGGRIWAESELDRGATFYFTLNKALSNQDDKKA